MKPWPYFLLLLMMAPGLASGSEEGRRLADNALADSGKAVLADAAGSILGHYYGAKVTSNFCMERFSDMRSDFRITQTTWTNRNSAAALETRDYAVRNSLYGTERELDDYLKGHLSNYIGKLSRLGAGDQKSYCFDTMIMMDDEKNDLTQRYRREYELIHSTQGSTL